MCIAVREELKSKTKDYDKSENDLKALQSVGQIVGEILKQLTEEKCKLDVDISHERMIILVIINLLSCTYLILSALCFLQSCE